MSFIDCRNCGERIPKGARACDHCGAPTTARRNIVVIIGALGALCIAAAVIAAIMLTGRSSDPGGTVVPQRADGDFGWLESAMKQCDDEAAKDPKALHYLVIPLIDEPRDDVGWRRISINDIGNAILVKAEDMIAGLKRKALRVGTEEYVFSARNETTKDVLTWKPSSGVRKFVISDASEIGEFKVQFQSNDAARAINWGATFERQAGNCYWVNAILRN
jgi:hypothetical protein